MCADAKPRFCAYCAANHVAPAGPDNLKERLDVAKAMLREASPYVPIALWDRINDFVSR